MFQGLLQVIHFISSVFSSRVGVHKSEQILGIEIGKLSIKDLDRKLENILGRGYWVILKLGVTKGFLATCECDRENDREFYYLPLLSEEYTRSDRVVPSVVLSPYTVSNPEPDIRHQNPESLPHPGGVREMEGGKGNEREREGLPLRSERWERESEEDRSI